MIAFLDVGLAHRQPELAAAADPGHGGLAAGHRPGHAPPGAASADPVALGEALFSRSPPACFSCHSLQEGVVLVGPSMAGLATRAGDLVAESGLQGTGPDAEEYIRESIVSPHAYLVPGQTFSAGGQSIMPPYETILKPEEIDQLVAYLATFK